MSRAAAVLGATALALVAAAPTGGWLLELGTGLSEPGAAKP